ncbi:MAG: class I adenylate-forming enzyme family protein [Desertimonas sp.]
MPEMTQGVLRRHAAQHPDAPAASSFHRQLTAAELDADADRVAGYLLERGIGPGRRVAYLGRNRVEAPAVLMATRRTRTTFVGGNFRLTGPEHAVAFGLARPDVVIAEPHLVDRLDEWRLAADHDPVVAVLGDEADDGDEERWGDLAGAPIPSPGDLAGDGEPDDMAMIYFTAGTSGAPKAVVHRLAACELAASRHDHLAIGPSTTQLIVPPSFHVAGALWSQFSLHGRSHQVLLSEAAPPTMLQAIERFGVTHAVFVPTLIRILVDALEPAGDAGPSTDTLRLIAYGASPIHPSLLDRAMRVLGSDFYQAYGMTEMNGVATHLLPDDHRPPPEHADRLRSAGRPVTGTEVRVTAPHTDTVVPVGIDGELQFRGPLAMVGYLDNPDATAAAFTGDGFFRTGDIGHLDDDGYVFVTDRLSETIITGGENVYPVEVENVIAARPEIADVAVVGVPDDRWGERVVAAVTLAAGTELDDTDLEAHCRAHLAGYKVPRDIKVVEAIPRNAAGKVVRREVRERWG